MAHMVAAMEKSRLCSAQVIKIDVLRAKHEACANPLDAIFPAEQVDQLGKCGKQPS